MTTDQRIYLIVYEDVTFTSVSNLDADDYKSAFDGYINVLDITNPKAVEELWFGNDPDKPRWRSLED